MSRRLLLGLALAAGVFAAAAGHMWVAAVQAPPPGSTPERPDGEWVEVVVAKRELAPGVRFVRDSLKDQVKRKKFRPDEVPGGAITSEEDLIDKQLVKLLRADDSIRDDDLGSWRACFMPSGGKDLVTLRMAASRADAYLKPGGRVRLIGTGVNRQNKVAAILVHPDAPIMAVASENGHLWLTVALTAEEVILIRMCETADVQLTHDTRVCDCERGNGRGTDEWSPTVVKKRLVELFGNPGTDKPSELPPGKDPVTVRLSFNRHALLVKPGSRIDLIGTGMTRTQKVVETVVLPDVLVLAVADFARPPDGFGTKCGVPVATLALDAEEALLVRMCETANVQLSYILRSEDGNRNPPPDGWSKEKVRQWLQDQQDNNPGLPGRNDGGQDTPKPADSAKIKLPVPTEDLPAGTEVTAELIERKFKDVEFVAPAPENAVKDIREHLGRYVVEKVFANQFVPRSAVGNKPEPKK